MTNGSPMTIRWSGRTNFKSNSSPFILDDLLYIPAATKNLLFVNQFCINNNVCLQFNSQKVQVKDLAIDEVLLQCRASRAIANPNKEDEASVERGANFKSSVALQAWPS